MKSVHYRYPIGIICLDNVFMIGWGLWLFRYPFAIQYSTFIIPPWFVAHEPKRWQNFFHAKPAKAFTRSSRSREGKWQAIPRSSFYKREQNPLILKSCESWFRQTPLPYWRRGALGQTRLRKEKANFLAYEASSPFLSSVKWSVETPTTVKKQLL